MNLKGAAKQFDRFMIQCKFSSDDDCVICLERINNSTVIHLPCGHTFHLACFKKQIVYAQQNRFTCSLCRRNTLSISKSI